MAFNLSQAIEGGLSLYAARLAESLTSKGSVASGSLGSSIKVLLKRPRRGVYTGQVVMNDYWEDVDEGQDAGDPPTIQSIIKWMSYRAVKDRFTFGREDKFNDAAIPSIAANIVKKIDRVGTKGNNFATEVFKEDSLLSDLTARITEAVENDLEDTIDEIRLIMKD